MSYRLDSSVLQRSRKGSPENDAGADQNNTDKGVLIEKEESNLGGDNFTSIDLKSNTTKQQRQRQLVIHWNSSALRWIFFSLTLGICFLLFKIFSYGINFSLSTKSHRILTPDRTFYNGTHHFGPTVILISLDGLRNDYLKRGVTPHLVEFGATGMQADYMLPSFPSITFPNHWTLATGLYPEAHGIVGNDFYDPNLKETFIHKKPPISTQPKWWTGEPIWKTASSQNMLSGVVMWPGSGTPTTKPDYFLDYDRNITAVAKMDTALEWLDLPIERRPQMISLYIPQIDQKGHGGGPDGPQMNMVLKNMDDAIGHLLSGLKNRNLDSHVNVVIVSDHGMAATHKTRVIYYDDILSKESLSYLMEREAWPLLNLRPKEDAPPHATQQIYDELFNYTQQYQQDAHFRVYLRQDVPPHYHYSNNDRIAPIVVIPDVGYSFVLHQEFDISLGKDYRPRGIHGYDNYALEMRAIFMARGTQVERKWGRGAIVKSFQNTEVYGFVASLLNLDPSPNNCTLCNVLISMQVKRGPAIPKKPHYLSNFDPELNKNAPDTVKESATSQHSPPWRSEFTTTQADAPTSIRDKQTCNTNGQKLNTKIPHKPPRRRKPTLTIQHLTLYSSSSPVNLLASSNNTTTTSSSSTTFGRQRASSSLQHSSQRHPKYSSDGPSKPRRPSAPQMTTSDGYFKHSNSSQWDFDLFEQQLHKSAKDKTDNAKTARTGPSDSKPTPMGGSTNQTSLHAASIPPISSVSSQPYSQTTPTPPPPPTNSSSKYDGMIAQLVEMGFDAMDAETAVKSSKDFTIQSCLDILVQGMSSSARGNHQRPQRAESGSSTTTSNRRPVSSSPSSFSSSTTTMPGRTQMESKGPSSFNLGKKQQQSHDGGYGEPDDMSSSSDEDDILSNDQKWQRQQEARRWDYLESVKKEQQKQQVQEHLQEELRKEQSRKQQQEQFEKQQQEQLRKQQYEQFEKQQQEQLRKQQHEQFEKQQQEQLRKQQHEQFEKQQQERLRKQLEEQQRQQKGNQSTFVGPSKTSSHTSAKSTFNEPPFAPRPVPNPRTSTSSSRSSSSSAFDTAPTTKPIGPDMIKKAIKARTRGNDLFKLGYYSEAEKSYNQALAILPDRHDITAIVINNRAAARLKNGQYQPCVADCGFVIEWTRQKSANEYRTMVVLDGDITIRWYDQLSKALHRKAEALEKLTRLVDAQLVYQELIKMDSGDTKARKGLERCQPPSSKPPPPPRRTPATSKPATPARPQQTASAFPELDYSIFEINKVDEPPPSKAVAAMRARQAEMAKEDSERMEKTDLVNARIDRWKRGKEKNIRALLSSLDTLLWPGAQWRGAPINELLEPKKVKICYMKAIAKVHPDKLPAATTVEQKLLASGIFSVLNQAWDEFRSANKI